MAFPCHRNFPHGSAALSTNNEPGSSTPGSGAETSLAKTLPQAPKPTLTPRPTLVDLVTSPLPVPRLESALVTIYTKVDLQKLQQICINIKRLSNNESYKNSFKA